MSRPTLFPFEAAYCYRPRWRLAAMPENTESDPVDRRPGAGGAVVEIECCGRPRSTCYCPQCGRKLRGNPLAELLAHCRRCERKLRAEVAGLEVCRGKGSTPVHGRIRRRVECADRWKGWGDALAARIDGSDRCQHES